ncbi:MAG: VWA domain-containing protein [Acutalibacter sp.]|nr:VWA domain-containing protein [Acutalibacter sp.]
MGKIFRRIVCLLLSVLLMPIGPMAKAALPAAEAGRKAPDYELGVRCDRQITALNEQLRSFRLEYQVWCEDWVSREAQPCRIILLLEDSALTAELLTPPQAKEKGDLTGLQASVQDFLTEFGKLSPRSQAGLVIFGGENVRTTSLTALDSPGIVKLTASLSGVGAGTEKEFDYASALRQAQALIQEESGEDSPIYLITLTAGNWREEGTEALTELQTLRGLGARSYTVSLCNNPEQEAEDFWQSMASAPLSTHHYLCAGDPSGCLSQIRRDVGAVLSVEVVERLDPRFTLTQSEQLRLRRAGAHLTSDRSGAWEISWEVPLPRKKTDPWKTILTVQARTAFPGGNDVPVDREGSGIYRAGGEILSFPAQYANVPLALRMKDFTMELFLGERVKTVYKKTDLEKLLLATPVQEWFGKGKTGDFSFFWETEDGAPIGPLKQLGTLQPKQDSTYRLRVTYRPDTKGLLSAGKSVEAVEKSALLHVKLTSGTLRIRTTAEKGGTGEEIMLNKNSFLQFRVKGDNGVDRYCTARLEADPEGSDLQIGSVFLEGELTGLPFGVYTIVPVSGTVDCAEKFQTCCLGVWEQDDTVSPSRNFVRAQFTLKAE